MKCPTCQAVLLPVDGELFCLQCGEAYPAQGETTVDSQRPDMSATTDPLLQKAINDGNAHPVTFSLAHEAQVAPKRNGFASMRQVMGTGVVSGPSGAAMVMDRAALADTPLKPALPPAPQQNSAPQPAGGTVMVGQASPGGLLASYLAIPEPTPWMTSAKAWAIGAAVSVAFVLLNVGIARLYDGRVFPGVRVANLAVGGAGSALLEDQLRLVEASGSVTVRTGAVTQSVAMADVGTLDVSRVKQDAMAVGRTSALPVVGLVQAWYSAPVALHFDINEQQLTAAVQRVARQTQRPARNAQLAIVAGKAIVMREQTGQQINTVALEEAIRKALASGGNVTVPVKSVPADVAAVGLAAQLEQAKRILSASITLKLGDAQYSPTAEQIGTWLNVTPDAVQVNRDAVGAYVNSLPGRFDRELAVSQLIEPLSSGASTQISLGGRQKTASALGLAAPTYRYAYCLSAPTSELTEQLRLKVAQTLGDKGAWGMSGRIRYEEAAADCDWHLAILSEDGMRQLAPACEGQTSCSADGYIGIALESWQAAPKAWKGTQEAYRAELINHEVGHVLGFDHPACGKTDAKPVLSEPDVVHTSGCSPEWYALPADAATSTIRAGF